MAKIDNLIEGYTLVARPSKKGKSPPHLVPYQEQFKQVSKEVATKTKHLKGEKRILAMNNQIREKLRKEKHDQ